MQTLSTIIVVVALCIAVFVAIYITDLLKQKLPSHTLPALEQFARMAVRKVEQQSLGISGATKKQLAIACVGVLFNEYKLPIPTIEAIDIAIEAAVLSCPKAPKLVEPTTDE